MCFGHTYCQQFFGTIMMNFVQFLNIAHRLLKEVCPIQPLNGKCGYQKLKDNFWTCASLSYLSEAGSILQ